MYEAWEKSLTTEDNESKSKSKKLCELSYLYNSKRISFKRKLLRNQVI